MAKALYYPPANRTTQNFASAYPGVIFSSLRCLVLHTTETSGWPGYSGGASAPTFTAMPDHTNKKLIWRQHYPLNMSARALRNDPGGVNTNTTSVVQIELVGTSDKGGPGMYWPEAPDWALQDLADFCKWLKAEWGVPTSGSVKWVDYPASYGFNASQRLSGGTWLDYRGILGHQHVPENDHGDPGLFPFARLAKFFNPVEEFVVATKEEVKAALQEVLTSNLDEIGVAVTRAPIGRMWDGKTSTLGGTLSSAQYYAINGGFDGPIPDTASSAPGGETVARNARQALELVEANQKSLAEQLVTLGKAVAELSAKVDKLVPTQPTT